MRRIGEEEGDGGDNDDDSTIKASAYADLSLC